MRYRIAAGLVCLLLAFCIPLVSAAQVSGILFPAAPAGTVNTTVTSADPNFSPGNSGFVTGLALRTGLNTNTVFAQTGSTAIVFQAQGNTSQPVARFTALEAPDPMDISAHSGLFVWTSGSSASLATELPSLPGNVIVIKSGKVVTYAGPPGTGITVGAVTTISENPGVHYYFLGNVSEIRPVTTTAATAAAKVIVIGTNAVPTIVSPSANAIYFARGISVTTPGQSLLTNNEQFDIGPSSVRYYEDSVPAGKQHEWIDINWTDPDKNLELTIYAPDATLGPFNDSSDGRKDGRIFLDVAGMANLTAGNWFIKVQNDDGEIVDYTLNTYSA